MDPVMREPMRAALKADNPRAAKADIEQYLDAYMDYRKAQANIAEHGAVVAHPRTGAPIDNPYLKVRGEALKVLRTFRLKTDALWQ